MSDISGTMKPEMSLKELKKLRQELWVVVPFFTFALYLGPIAEFGLFEALSISDNHLLALY